MIDAADLLEKIDIVEYISQFCELEERDGELWCLSPLKPERTPSFSIDGTQQVFYDFASGCGGNVITFVEKYNGVSFLRALDILADYVGRDNVTTAKVAPLDAVRVIRQFVPSKSSSKQAEYSVLSPNFMDQYEFDLEKLRRWEEEGISLRSMKKYGVRYDRVSDRIVFPIKNTDGQIINISGRTLYPLWKEKNLRKYTYFQKLGICDVIYGLYEAMDAVVDRQEIILFEGAKSVLLADTYGIHNAGAVLTSHLNAYQMQILLKLGVRVVFALDSDVNIRDDKNIQKLKRYLPVEYIYNYENLLEPKQSPIDRGRDVFIKLYENRRRLN